MSEYGFSETDCKVIMNQIERRAKYRKEFLKRRTDPCKHSLEAGYVFDDAIQRYVSMKNCQMEYFQANPRTALLGFGMVVLPMFAYGYLLWNQRRKFERDCRCGNIKYRDRIFKFV